MSARMRCAFEALVLDQHCKQMSDFHDVTVTEDQRRQYLDELENGRPDYSGMQIEPNWPVFRAAWNLSREALVITLPPRALPIDFQGRAIYSMSGEGRNAALDEVRTIIESEGVSVQ